MHAAPFAVVHARGTRGVAIVLGVLAAFEAASCVDEPSLDELAAQRVVLTQFAEEANFASYRTFAITETITIVTQQGDFAQADDVTKTADPANATPFLESIAAELTRRGYHRVDRSERPDLGVAVTGVFRTKAVALYGAWWGYGAAGAGYWGYGGASLASGAVGGGIAVWNSGAVVVEMFDLRPARDSNITGVTTPISLADAGRPADASPIDASALDGGAPIAIPIVWSAILYGVVEDVQSPTPPYAEMQQAFAQSPYLGTTENQ